MHTRVGSGNGVAGICWSYKTIMLNFFNSETARFLLRRRSENGKSRPKSRQANKRRQAESSARVWETHPNSNFGPNRIQPKIQQKKCVPIACIPLILWWQIPFLSRIFLLLNRTLSLESTLVGIFYLTKFMMQDNPWSVGQPSSLGPAHLFSCFILVRVLF